MPAYVIADIEVSDPAKYEGYRALSPGAIAAYGGRFLSRGGNMKVLEGDWAPSRVVIVEFPTAAQAQKFYDSPEYRAARQARAGAANHFNMIVVEGV
ncbi:MAG: DUF1330 domain-containing protein [Telmatospirillum sp.]|nr:DUF1330 domain-containing protein [Telmatospirillum sp.]